jgi:hypothetical protein
MSSAVEAKSKSLPLKQKAGTSRQTHVQKFYVLILGPTRDQQPYTRTIDTKYLQRLSSDSRVCVCAPQDGRHSAKNQTV